jgi:adenylate cyclase
MAPLMTSAKLQVVSIFHQLQLVIGRYYYFFSGYGNSRPSASLPAPSKLDSAYVVVVVPRTDTIVRVEAGRLRRRLASYYEALGPDDPVRIDVPKGGYTPTFNWNEEVASSAQTQAPTPPPASAETGRRPLILISALVLVLIAAITGWNLFLQDRQAVPSAADVTGKDPDKASNAFLMVLPFVTLANDSMEDRLAAGLVEAIVTDLAKLSGLSIMAHASLMNLDSQSADLDALRRKYGSTHALRGSLEREGDLLGGPPVPTWIFCALPRMLN